MATRTGSAVWEGTLKQGKGTMKLGSGAFEGPYSFSSRFEEGKSRSSCQTDQHDRDRETRTRWRRIQNHLHRFEDGSRCSRNRRSKIPRTSRPDEEDLPGLRGAFRDPDQSRRQVALAGPPIGALALPLQEMNSVFGADLHNPRHFGSAGLCKFHSAACGKFLKA